jgi:hypothetical protein
MVTFTPDVGQGNSGPQGAAMIEDGRFDTAGRDGLGVVGGPHVIAVIGYDGSEPTESNPLGEPLFSEYTVEKDLPKHDTTLAITVP